MSTESSQLPRAPSEPHGSHRRDADAEPNALRAAVDLLESATSLIRSAAAVDLAVYYAGTLPFLWCFVRFCAEMSRSAHAEARLWPGAAACALAYLGMKIFQTLFVHRLLLILRDEDRPLTFGGVIGAGWRAAVVQSSAPVVIALASCLLIPTAWAIAFYRHAQCCCDPGQGSVTSTIRESLRHSQFWPRQNHVLLTLHAGFGLCVFVNTWAFLILAPRLIHSLSGVETRLMSGAASPFNTTLLIAAAAITFALVDPLLTAAYAIRTFRIQSLTTGRDLALRWHMARPPEGLTRKVVALLVLSSALLCLRTAEAQTAPLTQPAAESPSPALPRTQAESPPPALPRTQAESPPLSLPRAARAELSPGAQDLDRRLDEILSRPDFAWRLPREDRLHDGPEHASWLEKWLVDALRTTWRGVKDAARWLSEFVEWLFGLDDPPRPSSTSSTAWARVADRGTIFLAILALVVSAVLLIRYRWRNRSTQAIAPTARDTAFAEAGLEATKLPENEWFERARQLAAAGNRREALRAMFLGNLARLIQAGELLAAPHKSVGDYRRELHRRAHSRPLTYRGYCATASVFESVWYGDHPVTDETLAQFTHDSELLRQDG